MKIEYFYSIYFFYQLIFGLLAIMQQDPTYRPIISKLLSVVVVSLLIVFTLRNESPDQGNYINFLQNPVPLDDVLSLTNKIEPLFQVLINSLAAIGLGIKSLNFIILLFNLTVTWKFIEKFSPETALSWCLFFSIYFQFSIGPLRYSVILSFLFLLLYYQNKIKKYSLMIFAGLTHKVGIVLYLVYLLLQFIKRRILILFLLTVSTIIALSNVATTEFIFENHIGFLPELYESRFLEYKARFEKTNFIFGGRSDIFSGSLFKSLALITLSFLLYSRLKAQYKDASILLFSYSFGAIFHLVFSDLKILGDRTAALFYSLEIIIIPYVLSQFRQKFMLRIIIILGCIFQNYLLYGIALRHSHFGL